MDRLLAGTPLHSDGKLTIVSLAAEADVRRHVLTHAHRPERPVLRPGQGPETVSQRVPCQRRISSRRSTGFYPRTSTGGLAPGQTGVDQAGNAGSSTSPGIPAAHPQGTARERSRSRAPAVLRGRVRPPPGWLAAPGLVTGVPLTGPARCPARSRTGSGQAGYGGAGHGWGVTEHAVEGPGAGQLLSVQPAVAAPGRGRLPRCAITVRAVRPSPAASGGPCCGGYDVGFGDRVRGGLRVPAV